jgi:hypothetical protein
MSEILDGTISSLVVNICLSVLPHIYEYNKYFFYSGMVSKLVRKLV